MYLVRRERTHTVGDKKVSRVLKEISTQTGSYISCEVHWVQHNTSTARVKGLKPQEAIKVFVHVTESYLVNVFTKSHVPRLITLKDVYNRHVRVEFKSHSGIITLKIYKPVVL